MAVWGRIMTAVQAGYSAFLSYNKEALAPLTAEQWDDYTARLFRYDLLSHYYHNTIYTTLEKYRATHLSQTNHGLYKRIRPIRNPYKRGVNSYPANVYGGQIDMVSLKTGAIPIVCQNNEERITRALLRLFEWSNLQAEKSGYVRRGAMLGDSPIGIVDERDKRKVRLEFIHPGKFKDVQFDAVRNVKSCIISYWKQDEQARAYLYELHIKKQENGLILFETFKDGKEHPFFPDASGTPVSKWEEDYGFVPIRFAMHMTGDAQFGMSIGHGILGKIDELNAAVSATHDQIGKIINPVWKAKNVNVPDAGLSLMDDKGDVPIVNVGEGDLEALVTQLQIADALAAIDAQYDEIKLDMPELSLADIREHGNLTKPGIDAGWQDAIGLIEEAMGNYDASLVAACKMAITIGGINGYRDFEGFNANSYDNGDMDFNIKSRSVIGDTLSKSETIQFMIAASATPAYGAVLKEIGKSDAEIEEAVLDAAEITLAQQANSMTSQLSSIGASLRQPPVNQPQPPQPVAPNGQSMPMQPNGNGANSNGR